MSLPTAPEKYDRRWATEVLRQLDAAARVSHHKGADVEMGTGERVILRSPDGNRWALAVNNAGALVTTLL